MSDEKKKKGNPKMSSRAMIDALRERGYLVYEPDEFDQAIEYYKGEAREEALKEFATKTGRAAAVLTARYRELEALCVPT